MGRAARLRFFVPWAALAVASGADLFGRATLERAAADADAAGAALAIPFLPFDAYARETAAGLEGDAVSERARVRDLVENGLSRRPMDPALLRRAARLEDEAGRETRGGDLLLEAVRAARDSTAFAVLAADARLALARRHAAAAARAVSRADRLEAAGSKPDAAKERALADGEVVLARAALAVVPVLRRALAADADGYTEMDLRVAEALRLQKDLDEMEGPR